MLNTIFSVYIAMTIYYTIQNIKESIKNKTVEEDLERKWKDLKTNAMFQELNLLRKKFHKKDGNR